MKLAKLTPEHKILMQQVKEEWLSRFYSAAPIDKELAKEGIDWLYTHTGKRKMPRVIFVDSPLMAQKAANYIEILLKKLKEKKVKINPKATDEVRDEVCDEVRDEVWNEVSNEVSNEVGDEVWNEVWNEVGDEVRDEVWNEVWNEVSNEVGDEVWNEVGDEVWNEVWNEVKKQKILKYFNFAWYAGGATDYGWVSFYDFFDRLGILDGQPRAQEKFRIFRDKLLKANVYDMIQLNRFCIVISLPKFVKRDVSGRVHSTNGHAIEFQDGYGINRIHGVKFDKPLFDKFTSGKMTALELITHGNQDQKRAMVLEYGNQKLVEELKAKVESEELDTKGNPMRILSIKDAEEDLVFYEGVDPAKNEKIHLRLPPSMKNRRPIEAKIWTFKELWNEYEKTGILPTFVQEE